VKNFERVEELVDWLAASGVDTTEWDKGTSKSVANLWDEYVKGELIFQISPPLRIVEVVQVTIERNGLLLLEMEQEFVNGQRRSRELPPSEKIKPGENCVEAAYRCLCEELGLSRDQISIIEPDNSTKDSVVESLSYPGLNTRYTIHDVYAYVKGLPDQDFWRENLATKDGDPIKRHLWAWRKRP
jgi:hypothetical protein